MIRPFTVYFDTNFYVWLSTADESLAYETIEALNALKIRHVLSETLIRELLSSEHRLTHDKMLVERVGRFRLPPYCTHDYLAWEVLLLSGWDRKLVAGALKTADDMTTQASSHSIVARRMASGRVSPERMTEIENSTRPLLDELGILLRPEDQEASLKSVQEFAERMINNLRNVVPEGTISGELKWSGDPMEDSKMLLGLLPPKNLEAAQESDRLNDSVTNSEDRPYQVAAGVADSGTKRKLAHTLRDSEHMKTFILHKDEIDLLQVDRAQLNLIKNVRPMHRLVEVGLSERCFTVSSLYELPRVIRKMKVN
ncbi:MAG: hypothetical protein QOH71_448 [Blastocatellia bacterium]|nr:hypothetical protein [Blastocatellia bacterium]